MRLEAVDLELTRDEVVELGAESNVMHAFRMVPEGAAPAPRDVALAANVTIPTPRFAKWVPPRVNGDSEYRGTATQQPIYVVAIQLFVCSSTRLCGQIYMDAWEDDGDRTEARGWSPAFLLWQGNGRVIQSFVDPPPATGAYDQYSGRDSNGYSPQYVTVPGSFVFQWVIDGDRSGGDAGLWTGVAATLNDITVQVQ